MVNVPAASLYKKALSKGRKRLERARTAANALYGKSKEEVATRSQTEMDTKCEKNRLAAAKCRRKQRVSQARKLANKRPIRHLEIDCHRRQVEP